jgi:ketosteroid isomerase-like protein
VLTKQDVRDVIDVYIRAWETQDPDLIVTIFTPAATYHERVMSDPIPDREAIREYWRTKVARDQANITCRLLNLYLDGDTAIAEWEAQFDDAAQGLRKRMREIAVLTFEGRRIASLREYWASETLPGRVPRRLHSSAEDWGLAMHGDHTTVEVGEGYDF